MPFFRINPDRSRTLRVLASIVAIRMASWMAGAASSFLPDGGEYLPTGPQPGDQTAPAVAISPDGGFLVWQDSSGNGDGGGIKARRIGKTFAGSLPAFWVNQNASVLNGAPDVALLSDGGAVVAWQAGPLGRPGIYARFLRPMTSATPSFAGPEIEIAPAGKTANQLPRLARLSDGSVILTWTSQGMDGDMASVAVQKLTALGEKVGAAFVANVTTVGNQRSPSVTPLADGNFAVAWIGENHRFDRSADVFARVFSASGFALTGEVRLNSSTNVCATPAIAALPSGGFAAAWAEFDYEDPANGWDVLAGSFDSNGVAQRTPDRINAYRLSSQLNPRLAVAGDTVLATWTSLGQDGFREGVFGRFLTATADVADDEFGLNETVVSQQLEPSVASDGVNHFVAAWTSFVSLEAGFDVIARKFARPAAVVALSQTISVTQEGIQLHWNSETGAHYQVERSVNLGVWSSEGGVRTATGTTDSVTLPLNSTSSFFRIVRLP